MEKAKNRKAMPIGRQGFTLLEILLVVAAIAILAGIVIVAINPSKQLGETRNSQRWSDVNTILNATYQYAIDHNGALPDGGAIGVPQAPAAAVAICNKTDLVAGTDCEDATFVDLGVLIEDEKYLTAIPSDPQCATEFSTCYTIVRSGNKRVTVSAPGAEQGDTISVTK
ncbi:MAG: type II secretion system protein [Candidatus Moraniibacteriota bacterium]